MSNIIHYFFYAHINKVNGKVYVGETKQNPPSKRWKNGKNYKSNKYFTRSIEKYGWENFEHIILEECDCTAQEMKEIEQYWIEHYDSRNPSKGYNIAPGGYDGLPPLALKKAKEWKLLHPEMLIQNVSAMHKWQQKHSCEIRAMRQSNIKKATTARKRPVECVETGIIYESASDAARKINGVSQSKICQVCNGKRNICGGFHWRYAK